MIKARPLFAALVLLPALLAACATPRHQPPPLSQSAVEEEQLAALTLAADTAMARRARVYDLAWPVLTANTALCEKTRLSTGLVFADRERRALMSANLREGDLERLGYDDAITVIHAMAGGPGAAAGIAAKDRLVAVGDETVEKLGSAMKAIKKALGDHEQVQLTLANASGERTVTLKGQTICDMPVKISPTQELNAHAAKGEIVMYTGLIRSLDDAALQFVIAHEAAHIAEKHPRKFWRNLWVTGAIVTGPPVYFGAYLGDSLLEVIGQKPDISLERRALAAMVPWVKAFEQEADYVGLYFFARAGGDLPSARRTFDLFTVEHPASIYAPGTHPMTPERVLAIEATIGEIEEKRAAGMPLVPERRR